MPEQNGIEKRIREVEQWRSAHEVHTEDQDRQVGELMRWKDKVAPWWTIIAALGAFFGATAGAEVLKRIAG